MKAPVFQQSKMNVRNKKWWYFQHTHLCRAASQSASFDGRGGFLISPAPSCSLRAALPPGPCSAPSMSHLLTAGDLRRATLHIWYKQGEIPTSKGVSPDHSTRDGITVQMVVLQKHFVFFFCQRKNTRRATQVGLISSDRISMRHSWSDLAPLHFVQ